MSVRNPPARPTGTRVNRPVPGKTGHARRQVGGNPGLAPAVRGGAGARSRTAGLRGLRLQARWWATGPFGIRRPPAPPPAVPTCFPVQTLPGGAATLEGGRKNRATDTPTYVHATGEPTANNEIPNSSPTKTRTKSGQRDNKFKGALPNYVACVQTYVRTPVARFRPGGPRPTTGPVGLGAPFPNSSKQRVPSAYVLKRDSRKGRDRDQTQTKTNLGLNRLRKRVRTYVRKRGRSAVRLRTYVFANPIFFRSRRNV